MKTTFAHTCSLRLLRLYPRAWRERYADEAAAVLEERPATFRTLFDLLLGMLDAYLHNELFTERKFVMLQRMRNSQMNIFLSFVFFSIFWALYSLTGLPVYRFGVPTWDLASPAPNYAFVSPLVQNLGLFALVTTLLGGGAFIAVALKQACVRNRQNIPPVVCTLLSIFALTQFFALIAFNAVFYKGGQFLGLSMLFGLVLFCLTSLLANALRLRQGIKRGQVSLRFMAPTLVPALAITATIVLFYFSFAPGFSSGIYRTFFAVFFLLALVGIAGGSVLYLVRQLRRVEFSPGFLHLTFILAGLTTLSMLATLGLLAYEAQVIYLHINADGLKLSSVSFLLVIVICIALSTLFSCFSLWRGLVATRELALG